LKLAKVSPSILSGDFGALREQVKLLELAGSDRVHIDVMDGHFVPNLTFGPVVIKSIRNATRLPFEAHLMIEHPEKLMEDFVESGCDILVVHPEAKHDMKQTIAFIHFLGKEAGIAINPDTPLQKVQKYMHEIGTLIIMSVYPGFAGQKFIPEVLPKIKEAREMIERLGLDIKLVVDGGITLETGKLAIEAGADELVAGTSIFKSDDIIKSIAQFKNL
jgi:ribulose-phosphate 3-epimerase